MSDQEIIFPNNVIDTISSRQVMGMKKCELRRDFYLIQYQILHTNIRRIVRQTVRRINNEILGEWSWVPGLMKKIIFNSCLWNKNLIFECWRYLSHVNEVNKREILIIMRSWDITIISSSNYDKLIYMNPLTEWQFQNTSQQDQMYTSPECKFSLSK